MGEALVSELWFSVGSYGVSAGLEWASLPHFESWEYTMESFWQTFYTGNVFGLRSLSFVRVWPKTGVVEIFPAHAPEYTVDFLPMSVAGLRVALCRHLRDCFAKVCAPRPPK